MVSKTVAALTGKWGRFVEGLIAPGTISMFKERGIGVEKVYQRVKEEHGNFPCLNLIFDGQGKTNIQTRLEAFMHQVQQFYKSRFD